MLDLRVVLAACLAAFVFLLAGIGVFATLRMGHKSSVAVVKEGGLPPEPVRALVVPRDPRAPVATPAAQTRVRAPAPPPAPEITGSIEQVLQVPPPAPVAIDDLLKPRPPALTRVEPVETPEMKETVPNRTVMAPVPPPKAKQAAAKRRHVRRTQSAANPAATAAMPLPFFLFNPQPAAAAR